MPLPACSVLESLALNGTRGIQNITSTFTCVDPDEGTAYHVH